MRNGGRASSFHASEKAQALSDPTRNSTLHGLVRKLQGDNNLLLVERGRENIIERIRLESRSRHTDIL